MTKTVEIKEAVGKTNRFFSRKEEKTVQNVELFGTDAPRVVIRSADYDSRSALRSVDSTIAILRHKALETYGLSLEDLTPDVIKSTESADKLSAISGAFGAINTMIKNLFDDPETRDILRSCIVSVEGAEVGEVVDNATPDAIRWLCNEVSSISELDETEFLGV